MPYSFIYDLTRISQRVFSQIFNPACSSGLHKSIGTKAKKLVKLFKIDEVTGLNSSDAITLMEDFIEVQFTNRNEREKFEKVKRKAILIPHCARSFMDKRCKADFDPKVPTYNCRSCTESCVVNKATVLGRKNGYDVYVIPGGSCAERILRDNNYEGVIGVACGMELKMGIELVKRLGIVFQGVFLTKNGCSNTNFNLESLEKVLEVSRQPSQKAHTLKKRQSKAQAKHTNAGGDPSTGILEEDLVTFPQEHVKKRKHPV